MCNTVNGQLIRLFVSYSREDQEFLDELTPTLKRCQRDFGIIVDSDVAVPKGRDWDRWISEAISSADVILCLISREYFASEYIVNNEVPSIQARFDLGVPCVPIFVRPCRIDNSSSFLSMQGMNAPDKPISDMSRNERDRFFASVERDIGTIVEEIVRNSSWRSPISVTTDDRGAFKSTDDGDATTERYNIVVVGRTGVGKSALINYLFGEIIRDSRPGLPVTARGFHRQNADFGGVPSTLFDSWGLETASASSWLTELNLELSRRGVDKPAAKWFHTVLHCIQASGHRIEPFEVAVLQKFRAENYRVIVVLTKADAVSRNVLTELQVTIRSEIDGELAVIPVCSVEEETLTGHTKRFGLAELIGQIRKGFWESIMDRVPSRCISVISRHIDKQCSQLIDFVQSETGFFNRKSVAREANNRLSQSLKDLARRDGVVEQILRSEITNTLTLYKKFAELMQDRVSHYDFSSQTYFDPVNKTLPDGEDIALAQGISIAIASFGAVNTIGTLLTAVGFLSAGLIWAGPIGIGVASVIALKVKARFLSDLTEAIREIYDQTKVQVRELDPKLRDAIAHIPIVPKDEGEGMAS